MLDADEFRNCVKLYVELHDRIAAETKNLSELRKKKDAIGVMIINFMLEKNIDECELQDNGGKLVRRESKRTETLKKEHILEEIMTLVGRDATKAQSSLESIFAKRAVETKHSLSRTKR